MYSRKGLQSTNGNQDMKLTIRSSVILSYVTPGSTPLRHLVYRVLDLPSSLKPLVYDYGSLGTATEQTYIHRIVENHVS